MLNSDPALMRAIQEDRYYRLQRRVVNPDFRTRRPRRRTTKS